LDLMSVSASVTERTAKGDSRGRSVTTVKSKRCFFVPALCDSRPLDCAPVCAAAEDDDDDDDDGGGAVVPWSWRWPHEERGGSCMDLWVEATAGRRLLMRSSAWPTAGSTKVKHSLGRRERKVEQKRWAHITHGHAHTHTHTHTRTRTTTRTTATITTVATTTAMTTTRAL
jgi:hypothetical protein